MDVERWMKNASKKRLTFWLCLIDFGHHHRSSAVAIAFSLTLYIDSVNYWSSVLVLGKATILKIQALCCGFGNWLRLQLHLLSQFQGHFQLQLELQSQLQVQLQIELQWLSHVECLTKHASTIHLNFSRFSHRFRVSKLISICKVIGKTKNAIEHRGKASRSSSTFMERLPGGCQRRPEASPDVPGGMPGASGAPPGRPKWHPKATENRCPGVPRYPPDTKSIK